KCAASTRHDVDPELIVHREYLSAFVTLHAAPGPSTSLRMTAELIPAPVDARATFVSSFAIHPEPIINRSVILSAAAFFACEESCGVEGPRSLKLSDAASGSSHRSLPLLAPKS